MMRIRTLLLLLVLAVMSVGCQQRPSDDYNTSAFTADITVKCEGNGETVVEAEILVGDPWLYPVLLVSGDELVAEAYGQTQTLGNAGTTTSPFYSTQFNNETSTLFKVSLNRSAETPAPNSTVELPDGIDLTSPSSGTSLSVVDNLSVTWEPAATEVDIRIGGTCQEGESIRSVEYYVAATATGSEQIPVMDILGGQGLATTETCDITVELVRESVGTVDSAYESGTIQAIQVRSADVTITP